MFNTLYMFSTAFESILVIFIFSRKLPNFFLISHYVYSVISSNNLFFSLSIIFPVFILIFNFGYLLCPLPFACLGLFSWLPK